MSSIVLSLAYALHMAATAVWIGGLFFLVFALPASVRNLPDTLRRGVVRSAIRRFLPLAWLCVAVFVGTGLMQMSASDQYEGMLVIRNTWAAAILVKHVIIGGMVVLLAWETWGLQSAFDRAALGLAPSDEARLRSLAARERWSMAASLALGGLVLALTAIARANA